MAINKIFIVLNLILMAFIIATYAFVHGIISIFQGQLSLLVIGGTIALGFLEIFFILFFMTLMYKAKRR